jgi:hypothetical protein
MEKEELIKRLHSLAPWQNQVEFTADEWERYIELARLVQATDPDTVEAALDEFVRQVSQQPFTEYEGDSKPFILMRVVFELPERASADERRSFKGWVNWPDADANNQVNLSWPVSWAGGSPKLISTYEGFEGLPYAAGMEYRHFLQNYPYRKL